VARPRECVVCKTVICGQGRFGQLNHWRLYAHVVSVGGRFHKTNWTVGLSPPAGIARFSMEVILLPGSRAGAR